MDYYVDESTIYDVAIDYNASYILGMAGRAWIALDATPTPTATPFVTGDVNGDDTINIVDSLIISQYYVGLNPSSFTEPLEAADTNCDSTVGIVDALLIARTYVGLNPSMWCGL